jgi:hypothetical protein
MDTPYQLPSFQEDAVLYDDSIVAYINKLTLLEDDATLASTKKPSLFDYDGS